MTWNVEFQRKRDGREGFPGTTHSSKDQQHRTTFKTLEDTRGSSKPAVFMDSGVLVDASSEVPGTREGGLGRCGGTWLGQG